MFAFPLFRTLRAPALTVLALWSFAALAASPLDALVETMAKSSDSDFRLHVLRGMNAGLKGKHALPAPVAWEALYARLEKDGSAEVRQEAQMLSAVFGGRAALEQLRQTLGDRAAKMEARESALDSLVAAHDVASEPALLALLGESGPLRRPALRGLAGYDDAPVPAAILAAYPSLTGEEKRDALGALVRRPASALLLLASVDHGQVPKTDLSAPFARQLQDLHDPAIDQWLKEKWGAVHTSSAEKQKEIARLKALLTPESIASGDVNHGRALFSQTCAICHTVFGAGAKIGPELPGAFEDVDYLLLNIVDPNAIIGKDYQQTVAQTKNGQTVIGIIGAQDASTVTLKTLGGAVMLQRAEIEKLTVLDISLMPEGLLSALGVPEVRDLFSYLRLHGQVPALLSAANVTDFTGDAGFERWVRSSAGAWQVAEGALIGKAAADRPEFVTSDFIAEDFHLSAELRVSGAGAAAEMVLRGESTNGGFAGARLRLSGGEAAIVRYQPGSSEVSARAAFTPAGDWTHVEVTALKGQVQVKVGDGVSMSAADSRLGRRTNFGFQIAGGEGELRIRKLQVELMPAK